MKAAVGFLFDYNGTRWTWEKDGKVYVYPIDSSQPQLVLDLSEEISSSGDMGLLGFALATDHHEGKP